MENHQEVKAWAPTTFLNGICCLICLQVMVTVQACLCETDLGTSHLVGAQALQHIDSNLCLCCVYIKLRRPTSPLTEILFGAGLWRQQHWRHTQDKAKRPLLVKLSSLQLDLISSQDIKIRLFLISRTVLFVLSPTIPIICYVKIGFFSYQNQKKIITRKAETKNNFKMEQQAVLFRYGCLNSC